MNLVRANYEVGLDEISVIMYVGSEFSRLIFLKGKDFLHFAPVISEGRTSPNIENTLYSRILLEQDSAGIMRLDRIFLAGEAHKLELKQFLSPQFAEAPIEYLVPKNLDTGALQQSVEEITSEYAVPISVAMRVLDPKNANYYSIDLLPQSFREGQKVFKLAWHGYLLMLLIFLGTLVFHDPGSGSRGRCPRCKQRTPGKAASAVREPAPPKDSRQFDGTEPAIYQCTRSVRQHRPELQSVEQSVLSPHPKRRRCQVRLDRRHYYQTGQYDRADGLHTLPAPDPAHREHV